MPCTIGTICLSSSWARRSSTRTQSDSSWRRPSSHVRPITATTTSQAAISSLMRCGTSVPGGIDVVSMKTSAALPKRLSSASWMVLARYASSRRYEMKTFTASAPASRLEIRN